MSSRSILDGLPMNHRTISRMDWYEDCEGQDPIDASWSLSGGWCPFAGWDIEGRKLVVKDVACEVSHYHKLSFDTLSHELRYGLYTGQWADSDNPSGLPPSEVYDKAIQCYLSFYTFDNTSEPFYHRVLTGQYGKRSPKVYAAIARYLTFGLE